MIRALGRRLRILWRIVATGLCFAGFGVGGVVLGFTVWPLLRLTAPNERVGVHRVRLAISLAMRTFIHAMRALGLLTWEVRHPERLAAHGQLVIANHPTLIDVVFLIGLMPGVECIVKEALWRNPFLRWPVSWAGYISNSTGEGLVADGAAALRAGRSLLIFPEGTRTDPAGGALALRRGAAQIALAAEVDLRPVVIDCAPPTLYRNNPWYRVPDRTPRWTLTVDEPIAIEPFRTPGVPVSRAARHLTDAIARWYAQRIPGGEGCRAGETARLSLI